MKAASAVAWVGDRLVPLDEAAVPLDDFGARYGAACFETMLVRHGRVFRLDTHLDRLVAGLHAMGVDPPSRDEIRRAVGEILSANAMQEASLRLVVSAGSGHAPRLDAAHGPLLTITAGALPPPAAPPRLRIVSVRVDEHRPLREAKTANFLPSLLARREARLGGSDDALLLNHAGDVAEAATANVFMLVGEVLVTPGLDSGPLPGVTRAALIEVAGDLGVPVDERRVPAAELAAADALVLTSSIAGIVTVAAVTGVMPASPAALDWRATAGEPVTITRLRAAYEALVERECAVARPRAGA